MQLEFSGELWIWKGPAPWYFVTVPDEGSENLKAASPGVTYGWGMIPVAVKVGRTEWTTSLWPKDGRYILGGWCRTGPGGDVFDGTDGPGSF